MLFLAETFMMCVNVFYITRNKISAGSDKRQRFSPWGSMGEILIFSRIKLKFRFWLYKKRGHTLWKFQLEITSNKNVIAKKPLTNLYEMNSSYKLFYFTGNNESLIDTAFLGKGIILIVKSKRGNFRSENGDGAIMKLIYHYIDCCLSVSSAPS